MTPRIVFSPLSHCWFVVTRYVEQTAANGTKYIVARTKFDVTDQMGAILSKAGRAAVKRGKPVRVEGY
jgi:hypothetical protein